MYSSISFKTLLGDQNETNLNSKYYFAFMSYGTMKIEIIGYKKFQIFYNNNLYNEK